MYDPANKDEKLKPPLPEENEFLFLSNDNINPATESLLRKAYAQVYADTFPLETGGEPLEAMLHYLKTKNGNNDCRIIVAGLNLKKALNDNNGGEVPVIKGITVSYYYPRTDIGLLGYVAVNPEFRKEGLGMKLVNLQAEFLQAAAMERGKNLRGWFLECNDPEKTDHNYGGLHAQKLVDKYTRHGLRKVPVDYAVPPTMYGGDIFDEKIRELMLMAAPHPETGEFPDQKATMDFIRSVYHALGVENPDGDADFQEMAEQIERKEAPDEEYRQECGMRRRGDTLDFLTP
jgi:GNAT superfamily N-acetyltransferase